MESQVNVSFQYTDALGHDHLRISYPWRESKRQIEVVFDRRLERTVLNDGGSGLGRELIVQIKRAVNEWAAQRNASHVDAEEDSP